LFYSSEIIRKGPFRFIGPIIFFKMCFSLSFFSLLS
jgi:hypothetical protein